MTKSEKQKVECPLAGVGSNRKRRVVPGRRVSVWQDEKGLEIYCTTIVPILSVLYCTL